MDYRKLRLFQTLAQELNFVRAAARLNISQPGLSQQIKQLEEQLGVQLLLRTSKRVSLTSAGEVFLADVNALIEKTNQATERARRAASGQTGTLVVGTTSLAMFVLLPELIASFRRKMKAIDIRFVHMNTSEQEQALIDGSIHVGVLHPPLYPSPLSLVNVAILPFDAVVSETNPLAQQRRIVLRDLASQPFILWSRRATPRTFDSVISHCVQSGFFPNIIMEIDRITGLLGLVSCGAGVSLLVRPYQALGRPGVVFRSLGKAAPKLDISIACREDNKLPAILSFVECAREFRYQVPKVG